MYTYGDLSDSNETDLVSASSSIAARIMDSFPVDWRSRLSPFRYDTPKINRIHLLNDNTLLDELYLELVMELEESIQLEESLIKQTSTYHKSCLGKEDLTEDLHILL